jgi:type IV fimbrial biogenesis protein FimT
MYPSITMSPTRPAQRGFTIIELIIAMVLVAILTAVGIPAMRNFTLQQRIVTTSQELQLDMAYARSEAITRSDSVSVCTSTNTTSCTGSAWTGGRIVFVDSNQNGAVNGTDVVLRKGGTPEASLTLAVVPAANFVSFNSRGQVNVARVFTTCYPGLKSRILSVRSTGNPSISTPVALCP